MMQQVHQLSEVAKYNEKGIGALCVLYVGTELTSRQSN